MRKNFAGFIMTYERPTVLANTIAKVFAQSIAPEKLLIVDNSESESSKKLIETMNDLRLEYTRIGYNSGPAGAASVGLQRLASEGYHWIYWGDDDDPPQDEGTFENQLNLALQVPNVGIVGEVGVDFNKYTGRTSSFKNSELKQVMDAYAIAGNRQMIINRKVLDQGVLPTAELFFGFEELDFCLKVKRAGFRIIFDGEKIKAGRARQGNYHPNYKWRGDRVQRDENLWRQYYSSRNMLHILSHNSFYIAYIYNLFKTVAKAIYSFRFGYIKGSKHFGIYWQAVSDHLKNKYGRKVFETN